MARISEERWAEVDQMIHAGESNHAINRETGITRGAISNRRAKVTGQPPPPPSGAGKKKAKRKADPRPGSRTPPAPPPEPDPIKGPTDQQLEGMCRKIAKAPAIPAKLVLHCDYCYSHFLHTAPEIAGALVDASHDDQDLRAMLEWLYTSWRRYAYVGLLASWVGVPAVHHLAPNFVYGAVAPLVGMPPRGGTGPRSRHEHPAPAGAGGASPSAPAPTSSNGAAAEPELMANAAEAFAGLDIDQLLAMARQFGIEIPDDIDPAALAAMLAGPVDAEPTMNGTDATATADVPANDVAQPAEPAEPAEAPAPAAGADPPAGE